MDESWDQYFSGLIFARQLGITMGNAFEDIELIVCRSDEMENTVTYLPL